jgi:NTE family protein
MIAFVLSGGGNRGALQVGALQVLLEAGIRPELLVGTSAGAINAAFLATDPTPVGARRLADLWQRVTRHEVYPGGPLRAAWHLLTRRDSLYPNGNFKAFLEAHIPPRMRFFHQLVVPVYITATDLRSGRLYLFGEDPEEPILDAIMASAAIPPIFPPWSYRGCVLVDGGVAANLPVGVAVEKGATEIYALDVWREKPPDQGRWNVWQIAVWSIGALMRQQWDRDLALCAVHPEVTLHHLPLYTERRLAFDDFSQAAELIAAGRSAAEAYLTTWNLPAVISPDQHARGWQRAFSWLVKGFDQVTDTLAPLTRRRGGPVPG